MTAYQESLDDAADARLPRRTLPRAAVFVAAPRCAARHLSLVPPATVSAPAVEEPAPTPSPQPPSPAAAPVRKSRRLPDAPLLPLALAFAGALLGLLVGYRLGLQGGTAGALAPVTLSAHSWAELLGYIASALVFAAFYMRSIVWIRATAIASNVFFIAYGALFGLLPILVLHALLLPLNLWRLRELLAGRSSR